MKNVVAACGILCAVTARVATVLARFKLSHALAALKEAAKILFIAMFVTLRSATWASTVHLEEGQKREDDAKNLHGVLAVSVSAHRDNEHTEH